MSKKFLFNDLTPIKDTSGGSRAETWVVKDKNNAIFVRKFASGAAGRRLIAQAGWLREFKGRIFCPEVLNEGQFRDFYFYDMNYLSPAATAIEKLMVSNTAHILTGINKSLADFSLLFNIKEGVKNSSERERYITEKFLQNIQIAKSKDRVFAELADAESITINGVSFSGLELLLENSAVKNTMASVVSEDLYTIGHGDLTLSNLLIQNEDIAFIDPNPTFEFISLEQEFSKVLQSTVVKYELFSQMSCDLAEPNSVSYKSATSQDFSEINQAILTSEAFMNLKLEKLFFHLAIHLARILPYIKPENKNRSYIYLAEIIRLLDSIAKDRYNLN